MITTVEIDNAFNPEFWNQHMINVYYKYCIEKSVLPKIHLINEQNTRKRLDLVGSPSAVSEMKERYELMLDIMKQKKSTSSQLNEHTMIWNHHQQVKLTLDDPSDAYNILILSCAEDDAMSNRLAAHLTEEGYSVKINFSNEIPSMVKSQCEKSDVVLVYFSGNYAKNEDCMRQIRQTNMLGKRIISILSTRKSPEQENYWLDSVMTADLYYELFKENIRFQFNEDFGLEYDKLLAELVSNLCLVLASIK